MEYHYLLLVLLQVVVIVLISFLQLAEAVAAATQVDDGKELTNLGYSDFSFSYLNCLTLSFLASKLMQLGSI